MFVSCSCPCALKGLDFPVGIKIPKLCELFCCTNDNSEINQSRHRFEENRSVITFWKLKDIEFSLLDPQTYKQYLPALKQSDSTEINKEVKKKQVLEVTLAIECVRSSNGKFYLLVYHTPSPVVLLPDVLMWFFCTVISYDMKNLAFLFYYVAWIYLFARLIEQLMTN